MLTIASKHQTKSWRKNQSWYKNGKHNECENYQKELLKKITNKHLESAKGLRIHKNQIVYDNAPLTKKYGFEVSEDFDAKQSFNNHTVYYNLKMICDKGGAQIRALREVYHFITSQYEICLQDSKNSFSKNRICQNSFFVNILDGDACYENINKFRYLEEKYCNDKIFIGDMFSFSQSEFLEKIIEDKMSKKELGQYYTTNSNMILQGMVVPPTDISYKKIIEPFAGNCDLLKNVKTTKKIKLYDIEPKRNDIVKRDTLLNPPSYKNSYVITNPPFLARNKSQSKEIFDRYKLNDLYKCFVKSLIDVPCNGGTIILPLNFWSGMRKEDKKLRKDFLKIYSIHLVNIFEEKVFDDTSYTVCSFQFHLRKFLDNMEIRFIIYSKDKTSSELITVLNEENDYIIGGEIFFLKNDAKYNISRLTSKNHKNTNLLIRCIDDTKKKICMEYVSDDKIYIDDTEKSSARTFLTLTIEPKISDKVQKELAKNFNSFLIDYRKKYHSLFLTNYRDNGRKRISFELVYTIVKHLLK